MSTATVWAKSPHLRDYAGEPIDLGQIFQMRNQPNDLKLLRYSYVLEVEGGEETSECLGCGRKFIDMNYRNAHSRRAQHEAVVIDGPNLKPPARPRANVNPDSEALWDLELEGAPPPPPLEKVGVAEDRGSEPRVRKGRGETFSLG